MRSGWRSREQDEGTPLAFRLGFPGQDGGLADPRDRAALADHVDVRADAGNDRMGCVREIGRASCRERV